jgi:YidC/Oxa1 family membrane protein insertase
LAPLFAAGFLGIDHFLPPWDVFYLPLFNLLIAIYKLPFADFALAIIIFTIVVRTVLAPLFVQQIRSQKEMQRMQPLIREVQRKHKGNRTKINEETMALYKEHGVNPAAGCLPVVLQLPLLYALYQALIRASNVVTLSATEVKSAAFAQLQAALPGITPIAGSTTQFNAPISGPCNLPAFDSGSFTHFLPLNCQLIDPLKLHEPIQTTVGWLFNLNLAQTDHTFALVVSGFSISALAILAAILQFVQVKMTTPGSTGDDPTATTTSTMTYMFPLLTVVWGGIFPSGLILYWVVYTAYLIVQQYTIMGWGNLFPILGWSPPGWSGPPGGTPPARKEPRDAQREAPGSAADGTRRGPPSKSQPSGSPVPPRPAARRTGGQKRRGRKR